MGLKLYRSLSRSEQVKTLLAGPSPISLMRQRLPTPLFPTLPLGNRSLHGPRLGAPSSPLYGNHSQPGPYMLNIWSYSELRNVCRSYWLPQPNGLAVIEAIRSFVTYDPPFPSVEGTYPRYIEYRFPSSEAHIHGILDPPLLFVEGTYPRYIWIHRFPLSKTHIHGVLIGSIA